MREETDKDNNGLYMIGAALPLTNSEEFSAATLMEKYNAELLAQIGATFAEAIDQYREIFQKECNLFCMDKLGFECFDEADSYGMLEMTWTGITAEELVRKRFGADFDRLATEEDQRRDKSEPS